MMDLQPPLMWTTIVMASPHEQHSIFDQGISMEAQYIAIILGNDEMDFI